MQRLYRELELDEVDKLRKDDCKRYDSCLDIAASYRWESFSCYGCLGYKPGEIKTVDHFIYAKFDYIYPPSGEFRGNKKFKNVLNKAMKKHNIDTRMSLEDC